MSALEPTRESKEERLSLPPSCTSPGSSSDIAFERVTSTVNALPDGGAAVTEMFCRLLVRNRDLIAENPETSSVLDMTAGNGSAIQALTFRDLGSLLEILETNLSSRLDFNRERNPLPEEYQDRPQAIAAAITEFLENPKQSLAKFRRWSCMGKNCPELAKKLRTAGLIDEGDEVEISGNKGASGDSKNVQIRIGTGEMRQRSDSWFLWNSDSGGMYAPHHDSHHFFFNGRIQPGDYPSLLSDIRDLRKLVSHAIETACSTDISFRMSLVADIPLVPITEKLADNLRLICFAKESEYGHAGDGYREGDIIARSSLKGNPVYSVGTIINDFEITHQIRYRGWRGWNVDHVRRFAAPRTLEQIVDFQNALKAVESSHKDLISAFMKHFTGGIGAYQSHLETVNVLPWFFYDYDDRGGYTGWFKYSIENMLSGITWARKEMKRLSPASSCFAQIAECIALYEKSEAFTLLEQAGTMGSRAIDRRSGKKDAFGGYDRYDRYGDDDWRKVDVFGSIRKDNPFSGRGDEFLRREGRSPTLERIAKISEEHHESVSLLWASLREIEYILTWAKFFGQCKVDTVFPTIDALRDDLLINEGRNLSLVVTRDPNEIVPNSIAFSPSQKAVVITGSNGGGKTHMLEMIGNVCVSAHKGLRATAAGAEIPILTNLDYSVNESVHSEEASSFQGDIRNLISVLEPFSKHLPGEHGLMLYDEFGRGTDRRDGIPLWIGLLKYLDDRNIYFAGSTHFNILGSLDQILEQYGLSVGIYTMEPETFRLVRGMGRSGGIAVAKQMGLDPEIISVAEAVAAQAENKTIRIPDLPACPNHASQNREFSFLGEKTLEELGIYTNAPVSMEWAAHRKLGSTTRVFAEYSPLASGDYQSTGLRQYLPQLRPDAADIFTENLCFPLSHEQREERIQTLERLLGAGVHDDFFGAFTALKEYPNLLNLYQNQKRTEGETIFAAMALGIGAARQIQDDKIDHSYFIQACTRVPVSEAFRNLECLCELTEKHDLTSCKSAAGKIRDFLASDAYVALKSHVEGNTFLCTGKGEFSLEDWMKWVNVCVPHQQALINVWRTALDIHFYSTAARAISSEGWARMNEGVEPGRLRFSRGQNLRLRYACDSVTPVDLDIGADRPAVLISGTNGGGKTQGLQLAGSMVFFGQQLGFGPAESFEAGEQSFLFAVLSSALHTNDASTFQNEMKRLADFIDEYKRMGEPSGGQLILDEPCRGTSEEEAIPIIAGLVHYFTRRGVRVMLTTHFSGVFDYLNRLDGGIASQSLYVDYFTENERFKLREGIGESSGIRVAASLGLPKEIIDVAMNVAAAMKAAGQL